MTTPAPPPNYFVHFYADPNFGFQPREGFPKTQLTVEVGALETPSFPKGKGLVTYPIEDGGIVLSVPSIQEINPDFRFVVLIREPISGGEIVHKTQILFQTLIAENLVAPGDRTAIQFLSPRTNISLPVIITPFRPLDPLPMEGRADLNLGRTFSSVVHVARHGLNIIPTLVPNLALERPPAPPLYFVPHTYHQPPVHLPPVFDCPQDLPPSQYRPLSLFQPAPTPRVRERPAPIVDETGRPVIGKPRHLHRRRLTSDEYA